MQKTLVLSLSILLLGGSISFAQNTVAPVLSNDTGFVPELTTRITPPTNIICVQNAVKVREASIGTAFTNFSSSISTTLTVRASALDAAWGTSDAKTRKTLRNEAWTNYKKANQTAKATFKTNKKAAWDTFKTASKACKTSVVESEVNDSLSI